MKVVLTMIVKNEEHVIERALNSCVNLVDAFCIVDTGSTDKTKEVITNFFDKHKRIKGEIIDFPFTSYSECRNVAIEGAKKHGDWGFWMDADEELILNNKWNRNDFKKSVLDNKPTQIVLVCNYGSLKYQRAQLYKLDSYTWYGPVHEVLRAKEGVNERSFVFPYGTMFIRAEGASWKDDISTKYENHAKILLEYQIEHNWEDPRWTFYLAQSYKDAALPLIHKNPKDERGLDLAKKSINFYRDRINAKGGFTEEIYYSQLMVARISFYFMPPENVIYEFLKCEEYNWSRRIEHIYDLTILYKDRQMWKNAKVICDHGHNMLQQGAVEHGLFIEKDLYTWRFYDNFSIVLYYNGLLNESLKVINWILEKYSKIMPEHERERIENNKRLTENAINPKQGIQLPTE